MTESQMQDTEKEKTIEEAFQELEALAQKLEDSSTSLDTVEKKMLQMDEDGTLHEF